MWRMHTGDRPKKCGNELIELNPLARLRLRCDGANEHGQVASPGGSAAAATTSIRIRKFWDRHRLLALGHPLPIRRVVQRLSHPYLKARQCLHHRSKDRVDDFEMKVELVLGRMSDGIRRYGRSGGGHTAGRLFLLVEARFLD